MVQQQDNHTGTGTSTTDEPVTSTAPSNPSVSTNSTTTTTSTLQRRIRTKTSNGDKNKNNPFTAGSRNNFPSLERAWMGKKEKQSAASSSSSPQDSQSSSSRNTSDHSLDLSIDARAALHEHLRHIAKFGLDGDGGETAWPEKQADAQQQQQEQQQGQDTTQQAASASSSSSSPVPIMMNTLDEEWENILQGNRPLHDGSFPSSTVVLPTFNRLQVLTDEENNHNIEVAVLEMTCIEAAEADDEHDMDDYFNSSKVWQLMTPEKNRGRMQAVVTNRHEEESSDEFDNEHDEEEDDDDDDGQASNTPESACLVETNHLSHDPKPDVGDNDTKEQQVEKAPSPCNSPSASPRASALVRSLPVQPSPFASSPLRVDDVLPPVAAAAAATAQEWERRPDALDGGLATAIFQHNNSLLATSIHEDLPLITSPFHTGTTDPEGSFAEWSVASVEHSFVVPSAVTPIRPLPPLSPIHSLRGSPSSTQRGSNSSGSGSSHSSSAGTGSHAQSPRLGNSSPRSWRAPSPARMTATDWGSRDEASPIRRASSPSPQDLASSARSLFSANDNDDDDDGEHPVDAVHKESSSSSSSPLSPSAKQAAQAAAKFWQTHHHSHSVPRSKAMTQWPQGGPTLVPAESFESSTVGLADGPCDPVATTAAATHKDMAALISVDTTSSTDKSTMSASCLRSIRSADDALERRRYYRSVVPRRILFPNDGNDDHYHGDSFDRPRHSF